jgi:hypothetical protein
MRPSLWELIPILLSLQESPRLTLWISVQSLRSRGWNNGIAKKSTRRSRSGSSSLNCNFLSNRRWMSQRTAIAWHQMVPHVLFCNSSRISRTDTISTPTDNIWRITSILYVLVVHHSSRTLHKFLKTFSSNWNSWCKLNIYQWISHCYNKLCAVIALTWASEYKKNSIICNIR